MLDASAILALIRREEGYRRVAEALEDGASISAVNASEVWARVLTDEDPDELRRELVAVGLKIVPFTDDDAMQVARWRPLTRALGLSLADRACLALASRLGATALTADRAWAELRLDVEVELIRP